MQKGYREKRIICSPVYAEVDLIPVRKDTLSRRAGGETSERQQRANRKAAERHFVQLVNANFVQPDVLLVDPTYAGGEEPADFAEADRNLVNYLRRISYLCARKKLPKPKYVAVTEGGAEGTEDENHRLHHHIILLAQGLTREEVEDLWSVGRGKKRQSLGRVNTRRAQPICGSLVDRAMYMLKAPKHRKKWHQSLGLKMPEVRLNDNRYTKRQILKWCTNGDAYDRDFWAKKYPTWKVSEAAVEFNDIEGAYYVRLRLWRDKSPWKESPTRAGRTARTGQPPAMAAARHTKRTAKSGTST